MRSQLRDLPNAAGRRRLHRPSYAVPPGGHGTGGTDVRHAAIAAGLLHDKLLANRRFNELMANEATYGWELELLTRAPEFQELLDEQEAFRKRVVREIALCRSAIHLRPISDEQIEATMSGAVVGDLD